MKIRTLNVLMNGALVGSLHKDVSGELSFAYDRHWLKSSWGAPAVTILTTYR